MSIRPPANQTRLLPHRVRPRFVWGGLAIVFVGIFVLAFADVVMSAPWAIAGGIVVAIGGLLCLAGGIMHDVELSEPAPGQEIAHVREGGVYPGVSASTGTHAPRAIEDAERTAIAEQKRIETTRNRPLPSLARSANIALIVIAGWLLLSPWLLGYPFTQTANHSTLREFVFAAILAWSGFLLHQTGRNRVAPVVCLVAGILFVLSPLAYPDSATQVKVNEVVVGALAVLFAALAMAPQGGRDPSS